MKSKNCENSKSKANMLEKSKLSDDIIAFMRILNAVRRSMKIWYCG